MSHIVRVGMADLNVCKAPDIITTLGLGSCIGLTLYDPRAKIGGMVHYMLPDSTIISDNSNVAKFADTGIRELLERMMQAGASRRLLEAKIAGGARMFAVSSSSLVGNIGEKLVAEDTGLNFGRTVELHCETGEFYIKAVNKPVRII